MFMPPTQQVSRADSIVDVTTIVTLNKADVTVRKAPPNAARASIAIPPDLRAAVTSGTAPTGRVLVPQAISAALARADDTAAQRAQAANAVQRSLVAWLDEHGSLTDPREPGGVRSGETVAQWRGSAALSSLATAWASDDIYRRFARCWPPRPPPSSSTT